MDEISEGGSRNFNMGLYQLDCGERAERLPREGRSKGGGVASDHQWPYRVTVPATRYPPGQYASNRVINWRQLRVRGMGATHRPVVTYVSRSVEGSGRESARTMVMHGAPRSTDRLPSNPAKYS